MTCPVCKYTIISSSSFLIIHLSIINAFYWLVPRQFIPHSTICDFINCRGGLVAPVEGSDRGLHIECVYMECVQRFTYGMEVQNVLGQGPKFEPLFQARRLSGPYDKTSFYSYYYYYQYYLGDFRCPKFQNIQREMFTETLVK